MGSSGKHGRGKDGSGLSGDRLPLVLIFSRGELLSSVCCRTIHVWPKLQWRLAAAGTPTTAETPPTVTVTCLNSLFYLIFFIYYFILLLAAVTYNVFRPTLFLLLLNTFHLIYVNVISFINYFLSTRFFFCYFATAACFQGLKEHQNFIFTPNYFIFTLFSFHFIYFWMYFGLFFVYSFIFAAVAVFRLCNGIVTVCPPARQTNKKKTLNASELYCNELFIIYGLICLYIFLSYNRCKMLHYKLHINSNDSRCVKWRNEERSRGEGGAPTSLFSVYEDWAT